jgi:hypothetical protein
LPAGSADFLSCTEAVIASCRTLLFTYDGSKAAAISIVQCAMRAAPPL